MGFYEKHCLPHVINCACGIRPIQRQRQKSFHRRVGACSKSVWVPD